ncbi:MAG TPA: L,D-transpeptidase [Thermomicrobiales bacterium]|nr:L,D-transpeptidase [Thermomicrobiales bacterium]
MLTFGMLFSLLGGMATPVAHAQDVEWAPPVAVYVDETGQIVDKTFLDTWRSYQMLIGDPISSETAEKVKVDGVKTKTRTVQYFQNVALVATYDDKRGDDWNIQALSLGEQALAANNKALAREDIPAKGTCDGFGEDECTSFKSTGHTLKLGFKGYWETNAGAQLIGAPLTEEFVAKDGWTTQYFEKAVLRWNADQGIVPLDLGKQAAKEAKVSLRKASQPDDVPTYDESLFYAPVIATTPTGPGPIQGGYKEIVVSISEQYLWAYEDGGTVLETYVSTGTAETPAVTTPVGYFSILTKYDSQTMEGTISGEYYRVEDVPYVMYFDNLGDALHGTYWHNNFGTPMSHGCVNLPMDVAAWMYEWAPIGTLVTVIA